MRNVELTNMHEAAAQTLHLHPLSCNGTPLAIWRLSYHFSATSNSRVKTRTIRFPSLNCCRRPVMRNMLSTLALFASCLAPAYAIPLSCHSQTQPNPVTQAFPKDVTGVINGTTAIVPIPYSVAKSIVPSKFPILIAAYKQVFPALGDGQYPAVLEAVQDHDVGQPPLKIPDFTVSLANACGCLVLCPTPPLIRTRSVCR
jgi:hypothetical protein